MVGLNLIKDGKLADTLHGRIMAPASPPRAIAADGNAPATSPATETRVVERLLTELSRRNAATELRLRILEMLARSGPRTSRDIPRSWPVTRQYIRAAFGRLVDDGLIERGAEDHGVSYRLTEPGRWVVEELGGRTGMATAARDLDP